MKSETLAAKAVEKTLRGKVQKQTFPPLLEIPQKRGIPTFHTASTATGYSFLGGLTGADPNRRNWLPLSPALTASRVFALLGAGPRPSAASRYAFSMARALFVRPPNSRSSWSCGFGHR